MARMNVALVLSSMLDSNWEEGLETRVHEAFEAMDEDIVKWQVLSVTDKGGGTIGFLVIVENKGE